MPGDRDPGGRDGATGPDDLGEGTGATVAARTASAPTALIHPSPVESAATVAAPPPTVPGRPAHTPAPPLVPTAGVRVLTEPIAPGSSRLHPPADDATDYPTAIMVDDSHYVVDRELARGGMGRISLARDRRLGRRVAIKELLTRDEWLTARFEREAWITARLQHPNIIHVYEAGRWQSGAPFYAMNLVTGRPLDQVIAEMTSPTERMALVANVVAVVDALAYAHSEGVIHRDLKPSNVLIGSFGETVVIDWGLAKDVAAVEQPMSEPPRPRESAVETIVGTVLGTPAYMPPEQAAGAVVGAAADVYALGAMLYHVLAGVPPYAARTSQELLSIVTVVAPRPLIDLAPNAPSDLIAIVQKAMAREPSDRFPTAKEMADELKRFQTGQLVTSYRYSTRELIRRWLRRHRGAVSVGVLAAIVLMIVGTASIVRVVDAERRARAAQGKAEQRADQVTLAQARVALDADPTAALGWLAQLGDDRRVWGDARSIAADAASRGVARVLQAGSGEVVALALSPDGRRLASGSDDQAVRVWELATGTPRDLCRAEAKVLAVAFDGDQVVAVDATGTIRRSATAGGCTVVHREPRAGLTRAVFAPGGRRLALFGDTATLWDAATGTHPVGSYQDGAWSPDGARLVVVNTQGVDRLDVATNLMSRLWAIPDERPIAAIATDGKRTSVARLGDHRVYDIIDGRLVEQHAEHDGPVNQIAYLNGAIVSTSSDAEFHDPPDVRTPRFRAGDRSIVVWHRYRDFERLAGHGGNISSLAVPAHGDAIASGGSDGMIRVWRSAGSHRLSDESYRTAVVASVADRGRAIVVGRPAWPPGARPTFDVVDLASGAVRALACCDPPARRDDGSAAGDARVDAKQLAMDGVGRRFVVLDSDQRVTAWDLDRPFGRFLGDRVAATAISGDGTTIATAATDGTITAWDTETGMGRRTGDGGAVTAIACSPDGKQIAAAAADRIQIFGRDRRTVDGPGEPLASLAFSPDGKLLVGGGAGELFGLHVWDLATGARRTWVGHAAAIQVLGFTPDGARVASGSADKTVRLWRLVDGQPTVLRGHGGPITSIAFSRDGRSLVSAGGEKIAWLWDLEFANGRALRGHHAFVVAAGFVDGDRRVVSADADGAVRFHADDLPHDQFGLRAWLAAPTLLERAPARPAPAPGSCGRPPIDRDGCRRVAAALDGLRWQLPCKPYRGGDTCESVLPRTTKTVTFGGDPGTTYAVTVRFRGVVEQQSYVDGAADGLWQAGGRPAQGTYNIYELRTSSPEQVYFLNAGKAQIRHAWPIDYQRTIRIAGGATVTLRADGQDGQQITNHDAAGVPLIIADIPPAPAPFDGQFIQIDVVSVEPL